MRFPLRQGRHTIPIACRSALQFDPIYPAGLALLSLASRAHDLPDRSLFVRPVTFKHMSLERVAKLHTTLREVRALHGFRAETLVPDLAFIGLVDDTLDATEEALQMVTGPRPHRAYAMVRVAYEAAQRLLVLATAEEYVHIGARAWLYYVDKDEALRTGRDSESVVADYRDKIIQAWALGYKDAESVVQAEMANLRKIKRPDNFLGRDMAAAVGAAYAVLAKAAGGELPANIVEVTRDAYRALCRDTHACLRLEPRDLTIDSDGFVDVVKHERNVTEIEEGVGAGLASALGEAVMAVNFRITRRRDVNLVAIRSAASQHVGDVREDFRQDFGLYLFKQGLAHATQVFSGVQLFNVAILPDCTISSSTTIGVDDEVFMATFDFKGACADQILQQLREAYPGVKLPERVSGEHRICHLPMPFTATVAASVGYFRHNSEDKFVPLVVTKIF